MLCVGQQFPQFKLESVVSNDLNNAFSEVSSDSYSGKWKVYFFWPLDFTFVCPTEIAEFGRMNDEFASRNTQLLGVSVDSKFVHLAWRNDHKDLNNLPFPMVSDFKRELGGALGIVDPVSGATFRATFIVDPDGIIRHVSVNDLGVGRNPKEVLRILEALQTGELTPCNWQPGDDVISV